MRKADIYTTNYENIPWLVEFWGKNWPYRAVVADESTRLKGFRLSHGGKRTAALSKVAKSTYRWLNLTGTPLPNGPVDLWGQMWFVDYGYRLGRTFTAFTDRWFDKWEYSLTPRPGAEEEIMSLISDVTISIRAKDWFDDLDEPVPMPVYLDMPARARSVYDDMEAEMFAELDSADDVEAFTAATRNMKCCQMANGAVYTHQEGEPVAWSLVHDTKLQALKDISDEVNNAPLMVVYNFKHDKERILKAFPEARVFESEQDRLDWNAGKIQKMLVHPDSAGHGLNFQDGGCIAVFFSQTWNLESRLQVIERIGPVRQLQAGHPRPVLSYELLMRDTTDEIMYERVATKATVQDTMRAYRDRKTLR
jgi:SNF2 family DNA or RNA helicase